MTPFKVLACGDVHANVELLGRAFKLAGEEKVDLIIFSGDFCSGDDLPDSASSNDFVNQAKPIIDAIANLKLSIFFVLGNHDPSILASKIHIYSHVIDLHGQRIHWNNYQFSGIGGSHFIIPQLRKQTLPFLEGSFPEPIDTPTQFSHVRTIVNGEFPQYIYSSVQLMYQDLFPCDILISHTPPLFPDKGNYRFASAGLYQLIAQHQPLLSISGHDHQPKVRIESISWPNGEKQKHTTFVYLGSLDNGKVGLIQLSKDEKHVDAEMRSLID